MGVEGLVISLRETLCKTRREGNRLTAGAGLLLSAAAAFARDEGLSGLEFAAGIPGTVGGGVYMNCGAYGSEMKDVVESSLVLGSDGEISILKARSARVFLPALKPEGKRRHCAGHHLFALSRPF